jgi:gentisate 1,2-dioxygenase
MKMNSSLVLNLFIIPFLMWGRLQQRHNSVAIDYCVSTGRDTFTLTDREIDENGLIVDPIKVVWTTESEFVTPPDLWHSHHNKSGVDAYACPIQDAGLVTQTRMNDIQFVGEN